MMRKNNLLLCLLLALFGVQAEAQSLHVWMDDMSVTADGETVTYMTVKMTDANDLYAGFQMGITVPEGISIHQVKSGRVMVNDAKLNEYRFEGLGHSLTVNMPNSTTIKVACMDTSLNAEFYPDDADGNIVEELFTIGLVGSPDMVNGEYTIEMWDVEMIHQNATGVKPANEDLAAKMTVTGGQDAFYSYTLSAAGYGTLILPFDTALPEGLAAFTCSSVEGGVLQLTEQMSLEANTPVILSGTPGTYKFTGEGTPVADSYTEGVLTGVFTATVIDDGYVLQQQSGKVGFYAVDASDPKTVPTNRCYLNLPVEVKRLKIVDDTDDITTIEVTDDSPEYDILGRRAKRSTKGVIVKDGVKVVRK